MRFDEYVKHDGLGLAELVENKEVHPSELVELAIERIEQANPTINAVVYKLYDLAREAARGALPAGPFRGVPYLLKDMVAHAGTEVSFGSRFMKQMHFKPDHSHEIVRRSEGAGLIFVGKTNAPEFGLLPITEPEAWGPTLNPWNLAHSPGGSSGGAGAAVAAGMVPFAHGNDGGGSVRIPSACCGLFGLKPSRGRNPGIVTENPDGIVVEHCLTRTVRDSAALLDVTRGPLPGDRFWAPSPQRSYLDEVAVDPAPLRIAFASEDFLGRPAHPDCRAAVEQAARLCEDLGHHVEEARPEVDGEAFNECFATLWTSMAASVFAMILRDAKQERVVEMASRVLGDRFVIEAGSRLLARSLKLPFEPNTRKAAAIGETVTHADAFLVAAELQKVSYQMGAFLDRYDCTLTPVLAKPPVRTGELTGLAMETLKERVLAYSAYTPICNAAGLPAMSVPLHWNAAGLPVGVQFAARFGDETTLFRLAGQLERAQPWFQRYPAPLV